MITSKDIFTDLQNEHADEFIPQVFDEKPAEIEILPATILTLSKSNAKSFHEQTKEMIKNTGYGLIQYVEVIKFFGKLDKVISGDSSSKNPDEKEGDKEFKEMIREEIKKYPQGKFTSPRGVKFEIAETGTKYNFEKCNDPELPIWEAEIQALTEKINKKKEFLKTLPIEGVEIHAGEGELVRVYPPSKSSTSSYKVTLGK